MSPRSRRPPSLNLSLSSRRSDTPSSSSSGSSCDSLDRDYPSERTMFPTPSGPYCFKQPTLSEVLSNTAPAPYTLPAFMAYLSQNHCLETLEFIMDASRYTKHYMAAANHTHPMSDPSVPSSNDSKDRTYVRQLWRKLLDAYIVPNGPREVNLPCTIRDQLLSIPNTRSPPPPESLDPAVGIVHELMQDSVLVPFLSECQQSQHQSAFCAEPISYEHHSAQSLNAPLYHGSLDDRIFRRTARESSSPVPQLAHSYTVPPPRRTASPFSPVLGWGSSNSSRHTTGSWSDQSMLDDSASSTPSWGTPMTPPTTPPSSDSPRRGERAEKGWKRMTGGLGRGLGFGKSSKAKEPVATSTSQPQPQYW